VTSPDEAMRAALEVARAAPLSGDVPVGAVVLDRTGAIIAIGHNERQVTHDATAHAELLALRRAGAAVGSWQLTGCTLAVTLEPCVMCAGAVVLARLDRLVFGAWDPKLGAAGSVWDLVRDRRHNHRLEVIGGVLEPECSALLREFFLDRRSASARPMPRGEGVW